MYRFLAIGGVRLTAGAEDVYRFVSRLYETGAFRFENLEPWLRRHVGEP